MAAGILVAAQAATTSIQVKQTPATTEYRTFPRGHPPPSLQAAGDGAAFCQSEFDVQCALRATATRSQSTVKSMTLTSVEITIGLRLTIWTPADGPPRFLAHEETHRAISEHYYRGAAAVAEQLATAVVARKPTLPRNPTSATVNTVLRRLKNQLIADYLRETHERSAFAQDRFDAITDHGRNRIANPDAMARAIADEESHWSPKR